MYTVREKFLRGGGAPGQCPVGPILFNIVINDLFSLPLKGTALGFADDNSLLYSATYKEELERNYEHDR